MLLIRPPCVRQARIHGVVPLGTTAAHVVMQWWPITPRSVWYWDGTIDLNNQPFKRRLWMPGRTPISYTASKPAPPLGCVPQVPRVPPSRIRQAITITAKSRCGSGVRYGRGHMLYSTAAAGQGGQRLQTSSTGQSSDLKCDEPHNYALCCGQCTQCSISSEVQSASPLDNVRQGGGISRLDSQKGTWRLLGS